MNISGIRPKQEFYAGMEKQEPEKKEMHRLNQVAIRMVEMPPLFSEEPMNGPAAAVKVMADTFRDYDREVVAVVNLRADCSLSELLTKKPQKNEIKKDTPGYGGKPRKYWGYGGFIKRKISCL